MFFTIKQLFKLLTPADRMQAYRCFIAMVCMAIVEMVGVASIVPFIAVLADSNAIVHHQLLIFLYHKLHFSNEHYFLVFLGCCVLIFLMMSNLLSMLTTSFIFNFTYSQEYNLSKHLFLNYLKQPYLFFLNRNVAELSHNVLSEVNLVINRTFISFMQFVSKFIVVVLIVFLLLIIDPVLVLIIGGFLGSAYIAIYALVKKKISQMSQITAISAQKKSKVVSDAFNSIKNIKLLGKEDYFSYLFSNYAKENAKSEAMGNILSYVPRSILEIVAFGGILLVIIYLLMIGKNITTAIPLLALYAFAALRIMPAIQTMFSSISLLRLNRFSFLELINDLSVSTSDLNISPFNLSLSTDDSLFFKEAIVFRNVSFRYPGSTHFIISDLNFIIPAYRTIGLAGVTGSGKTTIVDLMIGLFFPTQGEIFIDQQRLSSDVLHAWQKKIGYVAQDIVLIDDSIRNNIAFGVNPDQIDEEAVQEAAHMANIHDFIVRELPEGYDTLVGNNGIRLSGGQRQRISIARALYYRPEVLILDEATSSLDALTEEIILDSIHRLAHQKTIVVIAHRLTTLVECDMIHLLKDGKIIASDTYQQLLISCPVFQEMARVHIS